jgi:serine/threonine protein kinase/beta-lactam-binding protein with PASTA domain
MLKEGMFIQERYEIIGRIGTGGMADVYKAKDHKLNRFVAVKVLKQEFREDKAFISKFRVEAQSAAGLAHPNIVNVYDVGEDHGISYIVMELVEGISLKEYIDKKGRLAVREATSIAMQVCMGLEAAHRNGIVHRDVKPQNIIISTDGKVKVTDFGIARAATSNTINSSVMGSVHYSSPEQARGGYSDYKSDIYSLGISMYEMLTGTVPFDGDSTVAIAIKHLQEELPSPRKYVPDLPKSTVDIILKCTQKSPDRRYNDMAELIRDLKESLVNPEGDFVQLAPINHNARTVVISNEELNQIKQSYGETSVNQIPPAGPSGYHHPYNEQQPKGYNGYPSHQGGYSQAPVSGPGPVPGPAAAPGGYQAHPPYQDPYFDSEEDDDDESLSPKLEKFMTVGSIIIGIIILCIFLALAGNATGLLDFSAIKDRLSGSPKPVQTETVSGESETASEKITEKATEKDTAAVEVPSLANLTEEEALKELNGRSIGGVKSGEQPSADVEAGKIISQIPKAGEKVEKNTTVYYVISSGTAEVPIPELAGKALSEVQEACDKVGIKYQVNYTPNQSVLANHVIYSDPPEGTTVKTGTQITLWVSKPAEGEATAAFLKDYTGENIIDAQAGLEAADMIVVYQEQPSSEYPAGTVISQDISGENVAKGTNITLIVSSGAAQTSESSLGTVSSGTSETQVQTEEEVIVIGETEKSSGKYSCFVNLTAPEEYSGQPVKLVITQDGHSTTLIDGEVIKFPYQLRFSSDSASEGLVTLSLLNGDGSVGNEFEYQHVPFR